MIVFSTSDGTYQYGLNLVSLSGYGCYGSPFDRKTDSWVGKGIPVDSIDELSLKLLRCYKCLSNDLHETCVGDTPYKAVTKKSEIICKDAPGTCQR